MTWFSKLPKVELHVHLEGAIPHGALFDLIRKYGGDPSIPDVTALARRFEYKNFDQFIEAWSWKNQFLREYEDFSHIAELTARDMANQNIRYAEMFFSPSLFVRHGLKAIRHLHVDRIGHGTRAFEDPELLDYLQEHRTPLELCPVSNVCTGVVSAIAEHPIREYFERGLIISVNTDDPMMFGTTLEKEYELLMQECGFTRQEICRLILLGVESSWLSEDRKKLLAASFEKEPSWVG